MPDRRHVIVRADASPEIGLGHVMRSLALADELEAAGLSVTICGTGVPPELTAARRIVAPSHIDDAAAIVDLSPDLVVVDGYHITDEFFAVLDHLGIACAVIDDNGDTNAHRPIAVINHNPHADEAMYRHLRSRPRLLLGVEFALVRREFLDVARDAPDRHTGSVLVAFGGSDPCGLTGPVATRLASEGLEVRVAIGAAHPERSSLTAQLAERAGISVIEPHDYVRELAGAGAAVLGAGSSLLEAACLRTPTVAVVVADNQRRLAAAARDRSMVLDVLEADEHLPDRLADRVEMLRTAEPNPHALVPIDGARRVAASLATMIDQRVRLRPATHDDAAFVFELRTDAEVDRQSLHEAPDWQQHLVWFAAALDDPDRRIFIIERDSVPAGQIRLDADGDDDVISLAIVERERGRGLGRQALAAAKSLCGGDLIAHVKSDNSRSVAAFRASGFLAESDDDTMVLRWPRRDRVASEAGS